MMRVSTILRVLALAALLLAFGMTPAFAQDEAEGSPAEASVDLSALDDGSLVDEDIESLSGEEKLERGAAKIEDMRGGLDQTEDLLQTVRSRDSDIIKINCINEKLAAIKGFVKVSEQSYVSLDAAAKEADGGAENHHYTLISVAREKVSTLVAEAGLCTGEEMRFTGNAQIDVSTPETGDGEFEEPEATILVTDLPELTPYF